MKIFYCTKIVKMLIFFNRFKQKTGVFFYLKQKYWESANNYLFITSSCFGRRKMLFFTLWPCRTLFLRNLYCRSSFSLIGRAWKCQRHYPSFGKHVYLNLLCILSKSYTKTVLMLKNTLYFNKSSIYVDSYILDLMVYIIASTRRHMDWSGFCSNSSDNFNELSKPEE